MRSGVQTYVYVYDFNIGKLKALLIGMDAVTFETIFFLDELKFVVTIKFMTFWYENYVLYTSPFWTNETYLLLCFMEERKIK